jgi:hypothetical protein
MPPRGETGSLIDQREEKYTMQHLALRTGIVVACALLLVPALPAQETAANLVPSQEGSGGESREREPERERPEPIETDRDSFTPSTRTAGLDRLIIESAHSFIDNRGVPDTNSFPELITRYGLTEWLELRLGWNAEMGGGGNDITGSQGDVTLDNPHVKYEYRLTYGLKAQLTRQQEWVPQSVLIVEAFTPTGGASNFTQVVGTYAFGWKMPGDWRLDASFRYATANENGDHFNIWAPSVVAKVPLTERWEVHGEYFSLFSQGKESNFTRHYLSPGFRYLITDNFEVGARVGWGLNEQSARFFSNVGFGLRF